VGIVLWCEDEAAGIGGFAARLAGELAGSHPGLTVRVESREPGGIAGELASAGGTGPDLVWADWATAVALSATGLLRPVDGLFDLRGFEGAALGAVRTGRWTWAVPVSAGGMLMLFSNRDLVPAPPGDTDELLAVCRKLAAEGRRGLVWNQADPLWLVPWLHGFKGILVNARGAPTLATPQMEATLAFLSELREGNGAPVDSYQAGSLFAAGEAGMIVDGDWSMDGYRKALGPRLAVTRLPKVSATGQWPRPYLSGTCLMIPSWASGDRLTAARLFVGYAVSRGKQLDIPGSLAQLPVRREALEEPSFRADPVLSGAARQMQIGVPFPGAPWMGCVWRAVKAEMRDTFEGSATPREAAAAMQRDAESCIGRR
jgi:arabinogalactan oligomer/maltooligosaccharide transport system substrate-binding protein